MNYIERITTINLRKSFNRDANIYSGRIRELMNEELVWKKINKTDFAKKQSCVFISYCDMFSGINKSYEQIYLIDIFKAVENKIIEIFLSYEYCTHTYRKNGLMTPPRRRCTSSFERRYLIDQCNRTQNVCYISLFRIVFNDDRAPDGRLNNLLLRLARDRFYFSRSKCDRIQKAIWCFTEG